MQPPRQPHRFAALSILLFSFLFHFPFRHSTPSARKVTYARICWPQHTLYSVEVSFLHVRGTDHAVFLPTELFLPPSWLRCESSWKLA